MSAEQSHGFGSASVLLLLGRLGGNLGYFAGAFILARALGPADRGAVAFITTTALVVSMVSAAGLRETAHQFPNARRAVLRLLHAEHDQIELARMRVIGRTRGQCTRQPLR